MSSQNRSNHARRDVLSACLALSVALIVASPVFASTTVIVPATANTGTYMTTLTLTNATRIWLPFTATLTYTDASGAKNASAHYGVVPPRSTAYWANVYSDMFGAYQGLVGTLFVDTSVGVSVAPNLSGPANTIALPVTWPEDPALMDQGEAAVVSTTTVERSPAFRTNVILAEVGGNWATVRLGLLNEQGFEVGSRDFFLGPNDYFQINDVFGPNGLDLPWGDYIGYRVSASVVSGPGRVSGVTTKIDNWYGGAEVKIIGQPDYSCPPTGCGTPISFGD